MYQLEYETGWETNIIGFSPDIQHRIGKKIKKLEILEKVRHLKYGLSYFVVEVEQYRICFKQEGNTRTIVFVGNHKQYEKWYAEQ